MNKPMDQDNVIDISKLSRAEIKSLLGFHLAHIGINAENKQKAEAIAQMFADAFDIDVIPGDQSAFAASYIEVMNTPYLGTYGHLSIATNSLMLAISYVQSRGFTIDTDSYKYNAEGKMVAVYLKEDFGGFAVHLMQKR